MESELMEKNEAKFVLNRLLVQLYGDILKIEEKSLQEGEFSDLSVTEIHIIEAIGINGSRTMSEIAHDLSITVGTLTTAINKLIKKEYVERKRIEEDRRVVLVNLTDRGKLAYDNHAKLMVPVAWAISSAVMELTPSEPMTMTSSPTFTSGTLVTSIMH